MGKTTYRLSDELRIVNCYVRLKEIILNNRGVRVAKHPSCLLAGTVSTLKISTLIKYNKK
jgi:hypothetical protein